MPLLIEQLFPANEPSLLTIHELPALLEPLLRLQVTYPLASELQDTPPESVQSMREPVLLHDKLLPLTFPVPTTQLMAPPALVQVMSEPSTQYCLLLIVTQVLPSEFAGDDSDRSGEFTVGCVEGDTEVADAPGVAAVELAEDGLLAVATVGDFKLGEQPMDTDIATSMNPTERALYIINPFHQRYENFFRLKVSDEVARGFSFTVLRGSGAAYHRPCRNCCWA